MSAQQTLTEQKREEGDQYGLQRNFVSSIRLNAQHYLWKDALGFNIHPDITVKDREDFKIADVGTGTGIWVYEVKKEYPKTQIHGFDISLEQGPASEWMPVGSSLKQLDITKPLPDNLKGIYDVVNIRLFLVVVQNNDPLPIARNIIQMLKPGGWLQWSEHVVTDPTVEFARSEPKDSAMRTMCRMMHDSSKVGAWVPNLPSLLESEGMQNIRMQKYPIEPATRAYWTQLQFNSSMDYTYAALDNSTPDAAGPKVRKVIFEAVNEARDGAAFTFQPLIVLAKRPLA